VEFLVEFEVNIPYGTPASEVQDREDGEVVAAGKLIDAGNLVRVWRVSGESNKAKVLGLYSADNESQLDDLLRTLPLYEWMHVTITLLERHPNDPAAVSSSAHSERREKSALNSPLPDPRLTKIYRLEATLGSALDVGDVAFGRRRIVPLTGGAFTGPDLSGKLLPGASADWQIVLADGTALGDIRYTLQTDRGELLYVQSRGVRHGSASVLARLAHGEEVDPSEYTFRTSTRVETAVADLDWLNQGVFISVAGRRPGGVVYETYLVG
jgi:muconolactone delta-isomerase